MWMSRWPFRFALAHIRSGMRTPPLYPSARAPSMATSACPTSRAARCRRRTVPTPDDRRAGASPAPTIGPEAAWSCLIDATPPCAAPPRSPRSRPGQLSAGTAFAARPAPAIRERCVPPRATVKEMRNRSSRKRSAGWRPATGMVIALLLHAPGSLARAGCIDARCADEASIESARAFLESTCACSDPGQTHQKYRKCVRNSLKLPSVTNLLPEKRCRALVLRCESASICGKPNAAVCCTCLLYTSPSPRD